jgi:hypothetical protein
MWVLEVEVLNTSSLVSAVRLKRTMPLPTPWNRKASSPARE